MERIRNERKIESSNTNPDFSKDPVVLETTRESRTQEPSGRDMQISAL